MRIESLPEPLWRTRQLAHERRVDGWTEPHLSRRSRGIPHPLEDFLFDYYTFSAASLRRWHPGIGVRLEGESAVPFGSRRGISSPRPAPRSTPHSTAAAWSRSAGSGVCSQSQSNGRWHCPASACTNGRWCTANPPTRCATRRTRCRLGATGTDTVVESHRIACTHYDAFRFFTTDARPRNASQPTRERQQGDEQPGCLHATMDLYKWAYKPAPSRRPARRGLLRAGPRSGSSTCARRRTI